MPTSDPDLWSLLPAPLTFVAGVLALGIILAREVRKLLAEKNADQSEKLKQLSDDVEELTREVERLRDAAIADAREAHDKQLALVRDNGRLITLLVQHGIDPQQEAP